MGFSEHEIRIQTLIPCDLCGSFMRLKIVDEVIDGKYDGYLKQDEMLKKQLAARGYGVQVRYFCKKCSYTKRCN